MKKLLDSWSRAYDWLKGNINFPKPMVTLKKINLELTLQINSKLNLYY